LRWFTFFDGGNVFADGERIKVTICAILLVSVSAGISPIGPLKLSYGKALNAKNGDGTVANPGDKLQSFQFQLGTGF